MFFISRPPFPPALPAIVYIISSFLRASCTKARRKDSNSVTRKGLKEEDDKLCPLAPSPCPCCACPWSRHASELSSSLPPSSPSPDFPFIPSCPWATRPNSAAKEKQKTLRGGEGVVGTQMRSSKGRPSSSS